MKLLENSEVRCTLAVMAVGAAIFSILASFISPLSGIVTFAASAFLIAAYLVATGRRYRNIADLCESIDRVLHGFDDLFIAKSREGELSLLETEISKMTACLRERSDGLRRDKVRMSDAIADISHQLRTPLTSMNLTLSRLIGDELSGSERTKLLFSLKSQMTRIDTLIEALLKMSKLDAGTAQMKKERLGVRTLVDRACIPFEVPMELRGQTLEISVADEHFVGDMTWTLEALGNIIKNCIEHTPDGGTIRIIAAECPLYTEIKISDSGDGIAPEDLPRIFDRFYKGKGSPETSIGIGLALSRAVVSEQGGTLTAANAVGGGAVFTIRFYKGVV